MRQTVWSHLAHLAGHGRAVLVTTHYIEEARQAGRVGLLRGGRLLAEESPEALLGRTGAATLEAAFLVLCRQGAGHSKPAALPCYDPVMDPGKNTVETRPRPHRCSTPAASNMLALTVKNLLKIRRNLPMLLFVFLLPAVQVTFFCLAIGREPRDLVVGLVVTPECGPHPCLPCQAFTSAAGGPVRTVKEAGEEAALAGVAAGRLWAAVTVPANLSLPVRARLDMSNYQVGLVVQRWITATYSAYRARCGPVGSGGPGLLWETPVYGDKQPSFTEFMAPGIVIMVIFFLAVALTGEAFISERASGLLERSWVAGVHPAEILASHILVQFGVMAVQTFITLAVILGVFGVPCAGPMGWLAALTLLQGTAGMSFGFLLSSLCDSQAVAMQLSIGSFYPLLLLSGILWPLEGMPAWLQPLARFLPCTAACQAMRDIMLRGWSLTQPSVYLGLISSSLWILIFLVLSFVVVKIKL